MAADELVTRPDPAPACLSRVWIWHLGVAPHRRPALSSEKTPPETRQHPCGKALTTDIKWTVFILMVNAQTPYQMLHLFASQCLNSVVYIVKSAAFELLLNVVSICCSPFLSCKKALFWAWLQFFWVFFALCVFNPLLCSSVACKYSRGVPGSCLLC